MQPELFCVTVAANAESGDGPIDVSVQVELKSSETKGLTLAQIESLVLEMTKVVLSHGG